MFNVWLVFLGQSTFSRWNQHVGRFLHHHVGWWNDPFPQFFLVYSPFLSANSPFSHLPTIFPPFSHVFPTFPRPGSRFSVSPVACSQAKRRATTSLGEVTSVGRSRCPACRSGPRESLVIIITMAMVNISLRPCNNYGYYG